MVQAVLSTKCRRCSHFRHPQEFVAGGPITGYCFRCYEGHRKAMTALQGTPPDGCQECEVTFAELKRQTLTDNVSMFLHLKDGIYAILCQTCSDGYERKRQDLYRNTPYGHLKQI